MPERSPKRIAPPISVKNGDILYRRLTNVMRARVMTNARRRSMCKFTRHQIKRVHNL
jgi:hypothetical protein